MKGTQRPFLHFVFPSRPQSSSPVRDTPSPQPSAPPLLKPILPLVWVSVCVPRCQGNGRLAGLCSEFACACAASGSAGPGSQPPPGRTRPSSRTQSPGECGLCSWLAVDGSAGPVTIGAAGVKDGPKGHWECAEERGDTGAQNAWKWGLLGPGTSSSRCSDGLWRCAPRATRAGELGTLLALLRPFFLFLKPFPHQVVSLSP